MRLFANLHDCGKTAVEGLHRPDDREVAVPVVLHKHMTSLPSHRIFKSVSVTIGSHARI